LDLSRVGVNLDIGHATIEGGLGNWIRSTQLLAPMTRGIAIKDFKWERSANGQWRPHWCPLGEGMVDFKKFFAILKESNFAGLVQLHFEYPLGGATTLTVDKSQVIATMKKDLAKLRDWLREA